MKTITERAMLAKLNVSTWSGRKFDKKVTAEVAEKHGAAQNAGRYNKSLIERDALKEIDRLHSQLRVFHYENTLPWSDDSFRILPAAQFFIYEQGMRERIAKFEAAVRAFCAVYPRLRSEARATLNGLYQESDYPAVDQIETKFGAAFAIAPMPSASDFRVALGDDHVAEIRAEITRHADQAIADAMKDAWKRIYDAVAHMVTRLEAYTIEEGTGKIKNPFRDSVVTNLSELVDLLPRLNITEDPELDRLTAEVKKQLIVAPDALRESESTRRKTAASAQAILDQMKDFIG